MLARPWSFLLASGQWLEQKRQVLAESFRLTDLQNGTKIALPWSNLNQEIRLRPNLIGGHQSCICKVILGAVYPENTIAGATLLGKRGVQRAPQSFRDFACRAGSRGEEGPGKGVNFLKWPDASLPICPGRPARTNGMLGTRPGGPLGNLFYLSIYFLP